MLIARSTLESANSWAEGVSPYKTILVTNNIYAIIRHPFYFGLICCQLSLYLLLPNLITSVAFALWLQTVFLQIRFEENQLLQLYGIEFINYSQKVGRLLPLKINNSFIL